MFIPGWVTAGVGAVAVKTIIPLVQEQRQADGFALAFWNKVFSALWVAPFVIVLGLPSDTRFYAAIAATSLLWCIADVVYFRALPVVGAGPISRLMPTTIFFTFILWFFYDHSLLARYLGHPGRSIFIAALILASTYFATRLKKCSMSRRAIYLIWPVLLAATLGPMIQKFSLGHAAATQAPTAIVFVQAIMMIGFWAIYSFVKQPVSFSVINSGHAAKTAAVMSLFSAAAVTLQNVVLAHLAHPAYLPALLLADSVFIVLIHRLMGRPDTGDVKAGFGAVACAAALAFVKD
ncbi:MAG TPA: hypothetical protein VL625_08725 [Patescibacteria group bacterium]|nr:hypothetical protein [Patescibacteria group bacterium]